MCRMRVKKAKKGEESQSRLRETSYVPAILNADGSRTGLSQSRLRETSYVPGSVLLKYALEHPNVSIPSPGNLLCADDSSVTVEEIE